MRLFVAAPMPNANAWTNTTARALSIQQMKERVVEDQLDGVFFDYEGNGLTAAQKQAYTALAQESTHALRPLNASVFVCVGARPTYELRNYDYKGLAAATEFLFIMVRPFPLYCGDVMIRIIGLQ